MSQLYGLLAGLFVCGATWGAMTFVSEQVGLLVGVFLLIFFTVTTIYINGDEANEHQKNLGKSLADLEIIFFDKLKTIEWKIDHLEKTFIDGQTRAIESANHSPELDHIIDMIDHILQDRRSQERVKETAMGEPVRGIPPIS